MLKRVLCCGFLLILTGCITVGPDYQRPAIDIPAAWRFEEQEARDLANTAWWGQFKDPVLNGLGTTALGEDKDLLVALGAHLLRADGAVVAQDHFRQPLDRAVAPGEAVEIRAEVPGPPEAGRYRLALDLVAEQICWFELMGSKPLVLEAEATDETPDSQQPGVLRASLALVDHGPRLEGPPGSLERLRVRATNRGPASEDAAVMGRV